MSSELPWLAHLDEDDLRSFFAELRDATRDAFLTLDPAGVDVCLRAWRVTAEALADPARREVLTRPLDDPDLCRQCDVFIGYGALGVSLPPPGHEGDREWLGSHCWVCGRSRDEIRVAGR